MSSDIARAIKYAFSSPNECDSNGEEANIVDAIYMLARAINRLADAVQAFGRSEAGGEGSENLKGILSERIR